MNVHPKKKYHPKMINSVVVNKLPHTIQVIYIKYTKKLMM